MAAAKKCTFNEEWLTKEEFSEFQKYGWLQKVSNDRYSAKCKVCNKTFLIKGMGISAVKSHMRGLKHLKQMLTFCNQQTLTTNLLQPQPVISPSGGSTGTSTNCASEQKHPDTSKTISTFMCNDNVTDAEIIWALKSVYSHYSMNSCAGMADTFKLMFPDSDIARKFSMSSSKIGYVVTYGLAPFFHIELSDLLKGVSHFVLAFDEALNKILQHGQMDIHIRFWDGNTNQVSTRYLTSQFLGHAKAIDIQKKFLKATDNLNMKKLVQLSMDGPNVNWCFYNELKKHLKDDPESPELLDIGSCGLHIVHGAFQTGADASGWQISYLLRSLYSLFHDSPAKRDDYENVTGNKKFPLKFCAHRWLDNIPVASRAIELWPDIKKYIQNALSSKKGKDPEKKSFTVVKEATKCDLTVAKLTFFVLVASLMRPFLIQFQTDRPMAPFLCDAIQNILRSLMARFLKEEVLEAANTPQKLSNVDVENESNHLPYKKIDIGFGAIKAMSIQPKMSEIQVMEFHMSCKTFLVATTSKIMKRNPLQYLMLRNVKCLSPKALAQFPNESKLRFCRILMLLLDKKIMSTQLCDIVKQQFCKFSESEVKSKAKEFLAFKEFRVNGIEADRLDDFFHTHLANIEEYKDLWEIVKLLLILSHGNATVESGFSTNKDLVVENLKAESLVCKRQVFDAIKNTGGVNNVKITPAMRRHVRSARRQYHEFLETSKTSKILEDKCENEKRKYQELSELKSKRIRLTADVKSLEKDADKFAELAEKMSMLTHLAKSNALRRSSKEKELEIKDLDQKIANYKC